MLPFVDTEPYTIEVPPPAQTPAVIAGQCTANEAQAQLAALVTEWNNAHRVKADSSAGEEAWHDADVAIERLHRSTGRCAGK
jgi:hypothetical protein